MSADIRVHIDDLASHELLDAAIKFTRVAQTRDIGPALACMCRRLAGALWDEVDGRLEHVFEISGQPGRSA